MAGAKGGIANWGSRVTIRAIHMSQNPFKIDVSARIARLPPYLFGRINRMKYEKRVAGVELWLNSIALTPDLLVRPL